MMLGIFFNHSAHSSLSVTDIELEFFYRKTDNGSNNTRQGYARKRTLKPAGFSFLGYPL
jgi:hypothetical protein